MFFFSSLVTNTVNPPRGRHMLLIMKHGKSEMSLLQTHSDFTALVFVLCLHKA